jgi:hypothetical protein
MLVYVLNLGRRWGDLRPLLLPVLGARGRWLATRNPADWGYVVGEANRTDPESVWQTGTKVERLVALRSLRRADPERARSLVAATWASDPPNERAAIIEAFVDGVGMADEPFLEATLDDPSEVVRRAAAELLARLPESRLAVRMAERARACLRWNGKLLGVAPPKGCDPAMIRDGVEPKPPTGIGERAWWLRQIISATPLKVWSPPDFPTPDCLVEAGRATEWAEDLRDGWARAATRERDETWAEALMRDPSWNEKGASARTRERELLGALSPDRRDALIFELLRAETAPLGPGSPAIRLLRHVSTPIGETLARELIRRVREEDTAPKIRMSDVFDYATFLKNLGRLVPPVLADEFELGAAGASRPSGLRGQYYGQFVEILRLRRDMHQELAR